MRRIGIVVFTACSAAMPAPPPSPGATDNCAPYRAHRVAIGGLTVCVETKPQETVLHMHRGGASYASSKPPAWERNGPVEGTDPGGMHVLGWYKRDQRDGGWRFTDDAGVVRAEGSYRLGSRDGRWTIRYASGQIASQVDWEYGLIEGTARYWYPDGRPWWRGRYEWGQPVGEWLHWDREGRRHVVDIEHERVGPLAGPTSTRDGNDRECAWEDSASLYVYLKEHARTLGTLHEEHSAIVGEVTDENGELVMRSADGRDDCRDEGGRSVTTHEWYDARLPH